VLSGPNPLVWSGRPEDRNQGPFVIKSQLQNSPGLNMPPRVLESFPCIQKNGPETLDVSEPNFCRTEYVGTKIRAH
jgi:hypothetical protein